MLLDTLVAVHRVDCAAIGLDTLGKPYRSTKGRPGGGLGLFLVSNVVRKLGGRLAAENREGGGAESGTVGNMMIARADQHDRVFG